MLKDVGKVVLEVGELVWFGVLGSERVSFWCGESWYL